jgi:hypothetical protein
MYLVTHLLLAFRICGRFASKPATAGYEVHVDELALTETATTESPNSA